MKKAIDIKQVMNRVFSLEVNKGHLKWKVSDLARISDVSRPLIYYHLGRTKQEILEHCLQTVTDEFYGLKQNHRSVKLTLKEEREKFFSGLILAQRFLVKIPSLTLFYLNYRSNATLAKRFIGIEKRYHEKLSRLFPKLSDDQILALHALLHGAVSAPFISEKAARVALKQVRLWVDAETE